MSYGGYGGGMYPPGGGMYGQQLLTNYPSYGMMNPYMGGYPNAYMGGYGGYGGYGGGYGYGGYGGMYLPYKPSTLRNIFNRIRHGSSYNYYPGYGYDYGRHRGSWMDYN